MGQIIQPFEEIQLKRMERWGAKLTGTDGGGRYVPAAAIDNVSRTQPTSIDGRPFTIILEDPAGLELSVAAVGYFKVQVNNKKYIDPNVAFHNLHPTALGNASVATMARDAGAFQVEPSTTAVDFDTSWVDMPGGSLIDNSVSGYVGSGAWRYVRLIGSSDVGVTSEISPTLTAFLYHTGSDQTGK
tara:strand:+ start:5845 stop:6402 length:558 start_codon:yes stop_codon:yes gene_type:complete